MTLFDRFRKKPQPLPQLVPENPAGTDDSLRTEVSTLYDRGVSPIHAIGAMLHDQNGNPLTDAKKIADIWLGINDLLDRHGIDSILRTQLVTLRNVIATTIEDTGPGPKAFVEVYRARTKRIDEMKFLQSYDLRDVDGNIQREAFEKMLVEIEHERANNPGSRAQDISDESLARLYDLRSNWDDPSKLGTDTTPIAAQDEKKSDGEAWIKYIEDSCNKHLGDVLNFKHPDWELAEESGDFRTLVTLYAAACAAYEEHADQMFSEWMKGAKLIGINTNKTTEFYFMVNRRFSHLAQIRCYLDCRLKLTLVPTDVRATVLPKLDQLLSPAMSDTFFPTPASIDQSPASPKS